MKKLTVLILTVIVLGVVVTSCGNTPPPATGWAAVTGKEWKLIEVQISDTIIRDVLFDRKELDENATKDVFTLKFDEGRINGKAAPNIFGGTFTGGDGQAINVVLPMFSTRMAAIFQPYRLSEENYYTFIHNAYKWDLKDGKLVLSSKSEDDRDVIMIFE